MPTDVYVERVPAIWNAQIENLSRAYYTSKVLNIDDQTHIDEYKALHLEHKSFYTADEWSNFFANYGVKEIETLSAFNSFAVTSLVRQGEARTRGFRITGVPQLVVNGRYRIQRNDLEETLSIAEYLVNLERSRLLADN